MSFVNDLKTNGIQAIKSRVKKSALTFAQNLSSKKDFMGMVQRMQDKYSVAKLSDRFHGFLERINDYVFGI